MKPNMWAHTLLAFILLTWMAQSKAQVQNLNDIRDGVENYVAEELEVSTQETDAEILVGRLDPRLRLKACAAPLEYEIVSGTVLDSRLTVRVECPGLPWQVRLPVAIKRFAWTVYAVEPIKRGAIIQGDQIALMRFDVSKLTRFYQDPKEVVGKVAKTTIRQGNIVKPTMVKLQTLVKRGERVKIKIQLPGLDIETLGIAMNDGVKNQTVQVKNLKSKRLIEATVTGPNAVSVNL